MAGGVGGAAGALLGVEVCAPLLLLCWLCCWPADDQSETSSSGKPPRKPVVLHEDGSRRASDIAVRHRGSSEVSLHLPRPTAGHSRSSSHRSHEEIPRRHHHTQHLDCVKDQDASRYHSAPSVIDEVIHRRDWERSSKDLYIPLKSDIEVQLDSDESLEAPRADAESSSIECKSDEKPAITCKKHYANIKSSKHKRNKEQSKENEKDTDATETGSFYIGDNYERVKFDDVSPADERVKSVYKAKEAKQSINESIKTKNKAVDDEDLSQDLSQDLSRVEEFKTKMFDFDVDLYADELESRSGARHYMESRSSLYPCVSTPTTASIEVGVNSGSIACASGVLRMRAMTGGRGRHASDGDILGSAPRPESGAFSESDVELEAVLCQERPPPYDALRHHDRNTADRKETAI